MTARSFRLKTVMAAGLVAVADLLLFDHDLGANLGLLMLAAQAVAASAHPETWRDRRAMAAFALAGGFALLLIDRPGLIAWFMAALALGVAVLSPRADARSDVADWALRLLRAGLMSLPAPVLDARRAGARGGRPGALRRALVAAALPVGGGAVFLGLFVLANPVLEAAWRLGGCRRCRCRGCCSGRGWRFSPGRCCGRAGRGGGSLRSGAAAGRGPLQPR